MHPETSSERASLARRDFLTSSASGLGTAALLSLLSHSPAVGQLAAGSERAAAAQVGPHFDPAAKACIYIFLAGAPSQIDLFDHKPELHKYAGQRLPESHTEDVRFAFISPSATLLPSRYAFGRFGESGLELSQLLPRLARCADDLAVIRSMHTEAFNHLPGHILMNTGVEKFGRPSVGSWVLYGLGSESQELPGYVVLTSRSLVRGGGANWSSGFLPPKFQGTQFHDQGQPILNLARPNGIPEPAQRASLDALREINQLSFQRKRDPEITARIEAYELAFRMQAAAPELIDLSAETARTIEEYGLNRELRDQVVATVDNKPRQVSRTFSKNCLLARRMVERGVRFVTIFHGDWDHHHGLDRGLRQNSRGVDQPIAALLGDLKQRGLLESTLVVIAGEFGRTCLGQGQNGRDHHPLAFTALLAGGGTRGGATIGKTDDFGWRPIDQPVHVHDLHATLLHLFGFDHQRLTYPFQGREFRLTDVAGRVISDVLKRPHKVT